MDPLYVINGKAVPDLNNLSPNSIASIRVLKQQPAKEVYAGLSIRVLKQQPAKEVYAGLYGKKALNGVVVIQTKETAKRNQINLIK
jgi:hypothetical protein